MAPSRIRPWELSADIERTLRYVVNDAGFNQGRSTPTPLTPTGGLNGTAGRFGVHAHERLANAIVAARSLALPHADRLFEGVRIDGATGKVLEIGAPPGGRAGELNFDLVFVREGLTLEAGDKLQAKAVFFGDAKYGALKGNKNQAAFAARFKLPHINLQAGNFKAQFAMQGSLSRIARTSGVVVKRQGGFATIEGMGFIAVATSAGIVLASEERLAAALDLVAATAADASVGAVFGKLARSGTLGGLLTMVLGMESDSGARNRATAQERMIHEFIHETYPGVLSASRYTILGWPFTRWEYEVEDWERYLDIYSKVESLVNDPSVLEEDRADSLEVDGGNDDGAADEDIDRDDDPIETFNVDAQVASSVLESQDYETSGTFNMAEDIQAGGREDGSPDNGDSAASSSEDGGSAAYPVAGDRSGGEADEDIDPGDEPIATFNVERDAASSTTESQDYETYGSFNMGDDIRTRVQGGGSVDYRRDDSGSGASSGDDGDTAAYPVARDGSDDACYPVAGDGSGEYHRGVKQEEDYSIPDAEVESVLEVEAFESDGL